MPSIPMICPNCKAKLSAKAELAGRQVKCPGCQQPLIIPTVQRARSAPPPPPPPVAINNPTPPPLDEAQAASEIGKLIGLDSPQRLRRPKAARSSGINWSRLAVALAALFFMTTTTIYRMSGNLSPGDADSNSSDTQANAREAGYTLGFQQGDFARKNGMRFEPSLREYEFMMCNAPTLLEQIPEKGTEAYAEFSRGYEDGYQHAYFGN